MTAPSILLVEDEQDLRWVLRLLFEDAGFVVHEAADGAKGLRAAAQIHPDVVLSDVRMPHITGLELLRGLHKASPELPVILLSAVADLATAVGAMKEGPSTTRPSHSIQSDCCSACSVRWNSMRCAAK